MDLLNELLTMHGIQLNEDLGVLKDLKLGRMMNAFKQSYGRQSDRKRGESLTTEVIGNKLNRYQEIYNTSPIFDGKWPIKDWAAVQKNFKMVADKDHYPTGAAFYLHGKAIAVMVADYSQFRGKGKAGLAWDFSHVPLSDEQVNKIVNGPSQYAGLKTEPERYYHGDSLTVHRHPRQSGQVHERIDDRRVEVRHYEGVAQEIERAKWFFDRLGAETDGQVTIKIICADVEARKKRYGRPTPIARSQIKLFKDDIRTRLAKYKNSKVTSVESLDEFVRKVFEGGLKKITFAGHTYIAVPSSHVLGSNKDKPAPMSVERRNYVNDTMQRLFTGQTVNVSFEADRATSDYQTLTLSVKFKNGMIIPVAASYHDPSVKEGGGYVRVTF